MPRPHRVHVPGGLYHVIARANNDEKLFTDDIDRRKFFSLLREGLERYGHEVQSYVLMTNHVHLTIRVNEVPLSEIMHNLCMRYARWFNKRHGRRGHLFGHRYWCNLVDENRYLLGLLRYIHLNPVRAAMVARPEDYVWSSYRAYLDPEVATRVPWLTTGWVLSVLSPDPQRARSALRDFVAETPKDDTPFSRGSKTDRRFLGDEDFIRQAQTRAT